MLIAESFYCRGREKAACRWFERGGFTAGTRCRDSARQSCADEAQAAVLAKLNEGVRGFHAFNPNRAEGGSQAVGKN
ncbi:hypothetical protein FHJ31_26960 [Pseudomonas sp. Fig-3]|uniref:Uncharacterized protein n=1 Tax=Pseudomonas rhizophila TaxID=2045200 RepID=A0ABN5JM85_9PSED|nr:hypothetical protein CRX69_03280 [Pseudomonas rhizophila]MBD0703237.1 hypothetical protein [Pseudomonas sp. PSB1]TNB77710.1 hypothetical protein FHJ31_26960 [Pseudomonas sp. Fig-3]